MKIDFIKLKKTVGFLVLFGIFVFINLIVYFFVLRFDFSKDKSNTLSSSSKKIIKSLDKKIEIKLFISADLPTRLIPLKTDLLDLINEYQKESKSKIVVKIVDPKKSTEAKEEASSVGIPELQFSQVDKDKYAVSTTYFGLLISNGDKKEVIPQATNLETLEYDITSAIYKITKKELSKIGLVGSGINYNSGEDEILTLKKVLEKQFELSPMGDINSNNLNNQIKTLLLFTSEQKKYSTPEVDLIEGYIKNGGKVVAMVDGVSIDENNLTTSSADENLLNLFSKFGINLNKNLILSLSSQIINLLIPYPFWINTTNFDIKSPEFSSINNLIFPWVSSISIDSKNPNYKTKILVKSESSSWEQKENFTLSPNSILMPQKKDLKEFGVIGMSEVGSGSLIVIPSSRFIKEQFLSRNSNNLSFILNLVNSLASDGALSGIRSRMISNYPIKDMPDQTKDLIKYLNILLLPSILLLIGVSKTLKRK